MAMKACAVRPGARSTTATTRPGHATVARRAGGLGLRPSGWVEASGRAGEAPDPVVGHNLLLPPARPASARHERDESCPPQTRCRWPSPPVADSRPASDRAGCRPLAGPCVGRRCERPVSGSMWPESGRRSSTRPSSDPPPWTWRTRSSRRHPLPPRVRTQARQQRPSTVAGQVPSPRRWPPGDGWLPSFASRRGRAAARLPSRLPPTTRPAGRPDPEHWRCQSPTLRAASARRWPSSSASAPGTSTTLEASSLRQPPLSCGPCLERSDRGRRQVRGAPWSSPPTADHLRRQPPTPSSRHPC